MQEGTWACLRWRSPFFPGAGRRRPCSGAARWGMQTRTQNQRAQAWSQEAAAAQWPFGERKTTGQSALTVRCGMLWEQGPDRYFSSSQALPAVLANTTCCSALKHKPSKGLPQIVLPDDAEDYPESTSMRTAWDQHKYALLGWRQGALHKEGKPVCVQLGMVSRLSGTQAAEWHRAFTIFTLFLQMVFISGCLTYWPYTFIPLQKRVTCESFPLFTATSVIPVTAPWPFILLILDRSS